MLAKSLLCALVLAQTPTFTEPPVYVTAIDLVATVRDANGKLPRDLQPGDFVVVEDGKEVPVIGVEYLDGAAAIAPDAPPTPNEWQTVIYFDLTMTSQQHRNLMVEELSKQADALARLGTVEIVTATPKPSLVLEGTRDPEAIRAALRKILKVGTSNWIVANRRHFLNEIDSASDISSTRRFAQAATAAKPGVIFSYAVQEAELVARFQGNLFGWISRYPRHAPRALLLVSDGFELDPAPFYMQNSNDVNTAMHVQSELSRRRLFEENAETGTLLAAAGWMMINVPGALGRGGEWTDEVSRGGFGRIQEYISENPTKIEPAYLTIGASQSLHQLADATGGTVLNSGDADGIVDTLAQRVKITYQVSRPPDGKAREIRVKSKRAGLDVRAARWAASTTPDEVAAERVAKLLRGYPEKGDLPMNCRIDWRSDNEPDRLAGMLFVKVNLAELAPLLRERKPSFRVTIGARSGASGSLTVHRMVSAWDRDTMTFAWEAPVTSPNRKVRFAVSVEELTSGAWGATTIAK